MNFIINDLKLKLNDRENKIVLLTKEIEHNVQFIHQKEENLSTLTMKNKELSQVIAQREN